MEFNEFECICMPSCSEHIQLSNKKEFQLHEYAYAFLSLLYPNWFCVCGKSGWNHRVNSISCWQKSPGESMLCYISLPGFTITSSSFSFSSRPPSQIPCERTKSLQSKIQIISKSQNVTWHNRIEHGLRRFLMFCKKIKILEYSKSWNEEIVYWSNIIRCWSQGNLDTKHLKHFLF